MTSDGSGSLFLLRGGESDRGREGETLPDGEGRNKGVFDGRRGGMGERDDDGRLAVSKGGGLYHTIRMHARRRKGGRHERMDTPVAMMTACGADRKDQ